MDIVEVMIITKENERRANDAAKEAQQR